MLIVLSRFDVMFLPILCSYYIMDYEHGWMVTINGIQTLPNIDELGLDSLSFIESSTQWIDYNTDIKKKLRVTNCTVYWSLHMDPCMVVMHSFVSKYFLSSFMSHIKDILGFSVLVFLKLLNCWFCKQINAKTSWGK